MITNYNFVSLHLFVDILIKKENQYSKTISNNKLQSMKYACITQIIDLLKIDF